MKHNICIVPIFNQRAPYIWSTFASIQSSAMLAIKYRTVPAEMAMNIAQLNQVWHRCQPCFAFGAYDNGVMIGCIHGRLGQVNAFINGLYVLPEYQKIGVGSKLLALAERAASVYTNRMDLQTIGNSNTRNFYLSHKYKIVAPREGLCTKDISGLWRNATVPMFFCSDDVAHGCATIAQRYDTDFDMASVNHKHVPMFAYLNAGTGIGGYTLAKMGTPENDVRISQLCVEDMRRYDIVRELIENMAAMNNR